MRVRRWLAGLLAVTSLWAGCISTPALAGPAYWSPTNCYSQQPYRSMVWHGGTIALFANAYVISDFVWDGRPAILLSPAKLAAFIAQGIECGFGLPYWKSPTTYGPTLATTYDVVYLIRPGSCAARYILETGMGAVATGQIAGVFC